MLDAFVANEWRSLKQSKLNVAETKSFLQQLNFKARTEEVRRAVAIVDANNNGKLDYAEVSALIRLLRRRDAVERLFVAYSRSGHQMSLAQFHEFVVREQRQPVTRDECGALIRSLPPFDEPVLSVEGFEMYINDYSVNSARSPRCMRVYQDMTQPLSHYWIASSHNTYLVGDQLVIRLC